MKRIKIVSVGGARPNFVKIAALARAFEQYEQVDFQIIHTGQHYDTALDGVIFEQLQIPAPKYHLGVGSDTPNRQMAQMLSGLEPAYLELSPNLVIVVGDTTSTLAAALAAVKMNIPVAHVEAGLRSGDRTMPEEINRILADTLSDFLFVTEQSGVDHLLYQGITTDKIFLVGNCMIDTLIRCRKKASETQSLKRFGLLPENYALATFHRPSNVDAKSDLEVLIRLLAAAGLAMPVVLPLHPRMRDCLERFGLTAKLASLENIHVIDPLGYLEFLDLMAHAAIVITDSGGIQEETTFLGVPCLTLRSTTERPVTITLGTNELCPAGDTDTAISKIRQAISGNWKKGAIPDLWDGQSARRIADILVKKLTQSS